MRDDYVLLPDPARVMEGLRDTGYSFNTAVADIIDNSIAADAENVRVMLNMDPEGDTVLYIADDGYGMDFEGLINAMRYGSAEREDPSSLGKFGLGLKTASTAFCRCLSVISRGEDMTVRKVQWDLDHIVEKGEWKLRQPDITDDEMDIFEETAGEGTGTLVVWEKIDRLITRKKNSARTKEFNRIIDSLEKHISMVYQRFLDKNDDRARNVNIYLNGKPVESWDPFCLNEPKTVCLYEQGIEIEMPEYNEPQTLLIKAVMIPRTKEFSTPEAEASAHITTEMEGFYIYRENRLIHYGDWLGMYVRDPHDSLLRLELSFDYHLDEAFHVDIKKSRIILDQELFEFIKSQVLPGPRREAEQRYRKGTEETVEVASTNAHDAASRNIEEKAPRLEESKVDVKNEKTGEVEITNPNGKTSHRLTILHTENPDKCRVNPVETLEGSVLWEPAIIDGKQSVSINMSHPFYQKIYYPIIKESVMVTGLDALLWSLAEAELSTVNDYTKEQYEDMRIIVSKILKNLVSDLPDPSPEEG